MRVEGDSRSVCVGDIGLELDLNRRFETLKLAVR